MRFSVSPVPISTKRLRPWVFCLAALLGGTAHAGGADLAAVPFDQLVQREVVSGSELVRQISDSPSAVAIVTAADIRAYGYRTIADVIGSMRGLYTTSDRRYQYMGGRGFGAPGDYTGRIMVLIDGYVTQDSVFNQAYIDESGLIDLALVERVEYVPGTGSVTYGNNAMLGIINIVTRKGGNFNTLQLSGEAGSYDTYRQRATFGKRFDNGADLLLSASALTSQGQNLYFPAYDTPITNHGWANGIDDERNKRFFGKFSYDGLTVEAGYVDRNKTVPTKATQYSVFNTPFTIDDENSYLNAGYETDLGLYLYSASRFYYGHYAHEGHRVIDDPTPFAQRKHGADWWGVDQKFVGKWFANHSLMLGMEYRNDYSQYLSRAYFYPDGSINSAGSVKQAYARSTNSVYLADEYRFDERWRINVGARYDKANDLEANWSPRLALIYQPDFRTTLKASYSEAFRMPNADDRSFYGSDAVPEYVAAKEFVVQHDLDRRMRLTGSLYEYRRSKQQVYVDGLGHYAPVGNSLSRGLELEFEARWDNGVRARSSGAWQNSSDTNGQDAVNSPNVLGKFQLTAPLPGDWVRAGLEAQYVGSRLTAERRRLGGVALANLTFSSERNWHGLSASFSIRNLFDRDYEVVSPFTWAPGTGIDSLRMDGRTYWLQLNYDL
ncbi:TonB-dependent receptor [Dechloromonas sp. XY25]|uniref:TonB-dependent receptor n=1 Tax=Dechloromonas hankyongensis TaxID=2908002 RepID=A0ABS9K4W6_9RHOO|nr:TonB-dependent receptor [Dechloromonas hankyongensis]MCG2578221.1 TonB-dependent receptor [Dechloromonas hankyongensis]